MKINRREAVVLTLFTMADYPALIDPKSIVAQAAIGTDRKEPLADDVSIYRDTFGVPHVVGETEEAVFFGYGYAQAEDHLEKMMIQYRDAQGRRGGSRIRSPGRRLLALHPI